MPVAQDCMFTYRLMKNKVVVLRGERPVGTIKRHKFYDGVIVSVRGIISPSATPGWAFYKTIDEAMAALELELSHRQPPSGTQNGSSPQARRTHARASQRGFSRQPKRHSDEA